MVLSTTTDESETVVVSVGTTVVESTQVESVEHSVVVSVVVVVQAATAIDNAAKAMKFFIICLR
jgi:hypothetical protein